MKNVLLIQLPILRLSNYNEFNFRSLLFQFQLTMITRERNGTMETEQVLDCGNMTDNFTKVWSQYQYWCEGVLFIAVGCFGIVGNIISISILATRFV